MGDFQIPGAFKYLSRFETGKLHLAATVAMARSSVVPPYSIPLRQDRFSTVP